VRQTQEEDACIYIANVCMAVYEDIYYVFGLKRKFVLKLGLRLYIFLTLYVGAALCVRLIF
jgi:hypothetical protein